MTRDQLIAAMVRERYPFPIEQLELEGTEPCRTPELEWVRVKRNRARSDARRYREGAA